MLAQTVSLQGAAWTDTLPTCWYCRHLWDWGPVPGDADLFFLQCGLSREVVVFDRRGGRPGVHYQTLVPCPFCETPHWPHIWRLGATPHARPPIGRRRGESD